MDEALSNSFLHGFFKKAYDLNLNQTQTAELLQKYMAKRAAENPNIKRGFDKAITKMAENPANRGIMDSISSWLGSIDPETRTRILGALGTGAAGGLGGLILGGGKGALAGAGLGAGGYLGWRALLKPMLERMAQNASNRQQSQRAIPDTSAQFGQAEDPGLADHFAGAGRRYDKSQLPEGPGGRLGPNRSLQDIEGSPTAIGGSGRGFRGSNVFDNMNASRDPYRASQRFAASPASIY